MGLNFRTFFKHTEERTGKPNILNTLAIADKRSESLKTLNCL